VEKTKRTRSQAMDDYYITRYPACGGHSCFGFILGKIPGGLLKCPSEKALFLVWQGTKSGICGRQRNPKLYVCCICKQTFRRYGSWKYHKTITGHDEVKYVKSMKFTCRLCGKEVDVTGKELAVALAMCDDPEELEFTCESCECQQSGAVA